MSTFGQQFEAMMAEAAAKAIEEWVKLGQPEDISEFTRSFFSVPHPISPPPATEKKEKAKKCTARTVKGKMCSKCAKSGEVFCASHLPNRAELEPSDAKTPEKKSNTRKCCAVTAKGTKCSKNAKEGCDKCAIHSKDKVEKKEVKKTEAKKKSETRGSVVLMNSILEEEESVVDMKKIIDMELDAVTDSEEGEVEEEEEFDE